MAALRYSPPAHALPYPRIIKDLDKELRYSPLALSAYTADTAAILNPFRAVQARSVAC